MKWAIPVLFSILVIGGFGITQQAFALPTSIFFDDDPNCDPLFVDPDVDELGIGFPSDELISVFDIGTSPIPACLSAGPGPHSLVEMTNLTPDFWIDVWYVADGETFLSNFDGFVNGHSAFRIDSENSTFGCGVNCPLIFESFEPGNGVFEPGETWIFIIDDYFNIVGLPPGAIDSPGLPSPSPPSSGSIIAFHDFGAVGGTALPIDTTALLVAGAYTTASWMIPILVSAVGIGLAVFTLKRNH